MKKIFVILTLFFALSPAFADTTDADYAKLYKFANIPDFELVHQLDPYQNEDYQNYAWSPYPLFRLSSDLYFKNQTVKAGYYILTPRMVNDRYYVFFKDNGKVQFIIPVVKKEMVAPGFYDLHVPKAKQSKWQKFCKSVGDGFYTVFRKSARKAPPPQSYVETTYIDGNMFLVVLYFGNDKYTMVFKSTRF